MSCRTRRPRMARMRMFASRTIISLDSAFSAPAQLLKLGHDLFFINIRKRFGKAVRRGFQLRNMGGLRTLSTCGNVDTESFAVPGNSNRSVRFQESGDPLTKLSHADFDCGHRLAPPQ